MVSRHFCRGLDGEVSFQLEVGSAGVDVEAIGTGVIKSVVAAEVEIGFLCIFLIDAYWREGADEVDVVRRCVREVVLDGHVLELEVVLMEVKFFRMMLVTFVLCPTDEIGRADRQLRP